MNISLQVDSGMILELSLIQIIIDIDHMNNLLKLQIYLIREEIVIIQKIFSIGLIWINLLGKIKFLLKIIQVLILLNEQKFYGIH
jgi:hypothetical protein